MAVSNRVSDSFPTSKLHSVRQHRRRFFLLGSLLLFLTSTTQPASASGLLLARGPARTIDLRTFSGKTYLQTVLESNDGINAKTATDDAAAVTISSTAQIIAALGTFNPKVANDLYSHFDSGQADFQSAASHLAGQNLSPQQIQGAIAPYLINVHGQSYGAKVSASNVILLTSSSGTVVEISANDYFYNVAYQSPKTSSGRTYAVTSSRALLDPSDTDYLDEMGNYLASATSQEISDFYTAVFKLLTASDASGVSGLSSTGQTVLTDFLAIYTAELMRHYMVDLSVTNDAWDVDVGEVTLISAYVAASGMVMQDGKLIAGAPKAYSHAGSIGTHEADFTKLARLITSYENARSHHKDMIKSLTNLTPISTKSISLAVKGDVFRRALVYLDQPQFETGVQSNAAAITAAMVQLLLQIRTDQSAITAYALKHQ